MSKTAGKLMWMNLMRDLYTGNIMPWDKEILEEMPLPSDIVDPFASEEIKPLALMNLAYVSLSGWIAEAKKEKYYSERFVQMSRLVMKGVTIMGRGLVTMHNRGEDLSAAPVQIDDLISVGSYNFRKSYLGAVQFTSKRPEIAERLLINELGWANLLMRLFRTKEKLAEPVRGTQYEIHGGEPEPRIGEQGTGGELTGEADRLPDAAGEMAAAYSNVAALPGLDECGASAAGAFSSLDALFAPAAFSAQRALTTLGRSEKGAHKPEKKASGDGHRISEAEAPVPAEPETGQREQEPLVPEEEPRDPVPAEQGTGKREEEPAVSEEEIRDPVPAEPETGNRGEEPAVPEEEEIPPYLQILQKAYSRSGPDEDGGVVLTFEEIRLLAADPEFERAEPRAAANFRRILEQINSS